MISVVVGFVVPGRYRPDEQKDYQQGDFASADRYSGDGQTTTTFTGLLDLIQGDNAEDQP
ncbi:hypothetical protein AWC22_05575 [Mycobacterium riyadhense]|uniref:Uncharacterized protein n=1 Tax=Mycobacterium riyadhense TaxID=486698 RepID=A0A1X2BBA4_9MYCO|nr:hypothetical protein AWC22_05575 [Mycobacterium riyadhense]